MKLVVFIGKCFENIRAHDGDTVMRHQMVAVVVFQDRALQGGRVILVRWSLNGTTCSYYIGGRICTLLVQIIVLKCISLCAT